jgi:hypothetical protein
LRGTEQVGLVLLLHGPPAHPPNTAPGPGVALSVTVVPAAKSEKHVDPAPQLIPDGDDVTVPLPGSPKTETVSRTAGSAVNVAVTLFAASIVTTQLPVALVHAPLHPVNVLPVLAVAVSVTFVPEA